MSQPAPGSRPAVRSTTPAHGWIPWAWTALFFASAFRFTGSRDPLLAAQGVASPENLVELAVYGLVAAAAAVAWIRSGPRHWRSIGLRMMATYGLLAVGSTLWSRVALFSFVRGAQVVVIAVLTAVTMHVWKTGLRGFQADWRRIWLTVFSVIVILGVTGLTWPNWQKGRFAWQGMHTGAVAEFLAVAGILAVSMLFQAGWGVGKPALRWVRLSLGFVVVLLILTVTRGALAAFVAGVCATYVTASSVRSQWRIFTLMSLATLVFIGLAYFAEDLFAFILRGASVEQLMTLTGRTELWRYAAQILEGYALVGFGYGAGRVVLTEAIPWSGTGHNLWVEAAVSLGIAGFVVVTVLLVWTLYRSWRLQRMAPGPLGNLAVGLAVFIVFDGVSSQGFALPGSTLTVLALLIAGLSTGPLGPSPEAGTWRSLQRIPVEGRTSPVRAR